MCVFCVDLLAEIVHVKAYLNSSLRLGSFFFQRIVGHHNRGDFNHSHVYIGRVQQIANFFHPSSRKKSLHSCFEHCVSLVALATEFAVTTRLERHVCLNNSPLGQVFGLNLAWFPMLSPTLDGLRWNLAELICHDKSLPS